MDGVTRTLTRTFDADGNRTFLQYPDGQDPFYLYDGVDRFWEVGATNWMAYTFFDNQGRPSVTQRGFGANTGAITSYSYDPISRLSDLSQNLAGTAADIVQSHTYNPASQISSRTRTNDSYVFGQEVNSQLTYTVNGLNEYVQVGASSYVYDANGNLTNDGSSTFTYDVENRLASASGLKTAGLRYDPLGRLYETNNGAGGGITRFLYDGDELIAEYDASGNMLRRYLHGAGADDPLVSYDGPTLASPRFLHTDHQGSVIATSDVNGNLIGSPLTYDDWGMPASTNTGRFQYTGQAWIPELGMYHYKARVYSPVLGRFLQTDPVGYDDQINLYAYVANDPVNRTDPKGLYQCRGDEKQCSAVKDAVALGREALKSNKLTRTQKNMLSEALGRLGRENQANGVQIKFDSAAKIYSKSGGDAYTEPTRGGYTVTLPNGFSTLYNNYNEQMRGIGRSSNIDAPSARAGMLAHEGIHGWRFVNGLTLQGYNQDRERYEREANIANKAMARYSDSQATCELNGEC